MAELLSVMQYASLQKIHPNTVHQMIRDGRLAAHKAGRSWRISADAIPAPIGETAGVEVVIEATNTPKLTGSAEEKVKERSIDIAGVGMVEPDEEIKDLMRQKAKATLKREIDAIQKDDLLADVTSREADLESGRADLEAQRADLVEEATTEADRIRVDVERDKAIVSEWYQQMQDAIGAIADRLDTLKAGEELDANHPEKYLYPGAVKEHWGEIVVLLNKVMDIPALGDLNEPVKKTKRGSKNKAVVGPKAEMFEDENDIDEK